MRAGFPLVAVICEDERRRNAIRSRLLEVLDAGSLAKVMFFGVEDFVVHLQGLAKEDDLAPVLQPDPVEPAPPPVKMGRRIIRKYASTDAAENAPKEKLAIEAITRALRDQKKSKQ